MSSGRQAAGRMISASMLFSGSSTSNSRHQGQGQQQAEQARQVGPAPSSAQPLPGTGQHQQGQSQRKRHGQSVMEHRQAITAVGPEQPQRIEHKNGEEPAGTARILEQRAEADAQDRHHLRQRHHRPCRPVPPQCQRRSERHYRPRVQYQARGRTSSATPPRAPSRNAIARVCRTAPGSSGSRGGGGNASPSISRTRRCAAASRPPA